MTVVFKSKHIAFVEMKNKHMFRCSVVFMVTRVLRYLAEALVLVRTEEVSIYIVDCIK